MRSHVSARLVATMLAVLASTGAAVPRAAAVPPVEVHDGLGSLPGNTTATCVLQPAPVSLFAYVYPLPYYFTSLAWRIPTQSCAACPAPGLLNLTTVAFRVRWERIPCSASVDISVVGATGNPSCLVPDTSQVLCANVNYTLETNDEGDNYEVYTLALSPACCVSQDAFLLLKFTGFDTCYNTSNNLTTGLTATTALCVNCDEFVTVANQTPPFFDWCADSQTNSIWVQLQAECCGATPSRNRSWGHVKTIYR